MGEITSIAQKKKKTTSITNPVYKAYFDSSCGPRNPGGTAAYGAVIFRQKEHIWECSEVYHPPPGKERQNVELSRRISWINCGFGAVHPHWDAAWTNHGLRWLESRHPANVRPLENQRRHLWAFRSTRQNPNKRIFTHRVAMDTTRAKYHRRWLVQSASGNWEKAILGCWRMKACHWKMSMAHPQLELGL